MAPLDNISSDEPPTGQPPTILEGLGLLGFIAFVIWVIYKMYDLGIFTPDNYNPLA